MTTTFRHQGHYGGAHAAGGRIFGETAGKFPFWVVFVVINLVFFSRPLLSLADLAPGYGGPPGASSGGNYLSSIGAFIAGFGALILLAMAAAAFAKKRKAAAGHSWELGATTVEWASAPPFHHFLALSRIR